MYTTAVIIGAGHAGLAMSRRLTERSIDHVVLERGEVANSWRTQRWNSLRLLTPNWQTRLPGMAYSGSEPDGYMAMPEVVDFISRYATDIDAPVHPHTTVTTMSATDSGYQVTTDQGQWRCAVVVMANGASTVASVPAWAVAVPPAISMLTPLEYRSPAELALGGVLVVGASATGVQLAEEIQASGRPVTLAVGEHVRLPRTYRGRDIFWWLDATGVLDQRHDQVDDLTRARHVPSPQLIGAVDHRNVDLNTLGTRGVQVVGRLASINGGVAQFSGGLSNTCSLADLKMVRLLNSFDQWALSRSVEMSDQPERPDPIRVPSSPTLEMDLRTGHIETIIWATGFRPDYSWLNVPVFDRRGRIRHHGGVVADREGLYVLGTNLLRRRRSSYINGAEEDSHELAAHIHQHLSATSRNVRPERPLTLFPC